METAARLQQILNECAWQMQRLHDWKERSNADRQSYTHANRDGQFDMAYKLASFVQGVAHDADVALDYSRLDKALERGDFL